MKQLILALMIFLSITACKKNAATQSTTDAPASDTTITPSENATSEAGQTLGNVMKSMMDKMHQIEKTGNADYDLAAAMKEHHIGAVEMSAVEISSGNDTKLKDMAQKISDKQQKEITELETIMSQSKSGDTNYSQDDQGLGKAMMDNMMSMMEMPATKGSTDKDFAVMMIKHHKDGIKMGQIILKYAKNTKFREMTEKMIADQNKDIRELEMWLTQN